MIENDDSIVIKRSARVADAAAIAELSGELGYVSRRRRWGRGSKK